MQLHYHRQQLLAGVGKQVDVRAASLIDSIRPADCSIEFSLVG